MCTNLRPYDEPYFVGCKVVAKKKRGTCYYSIAMGFKYPTDRAVPKVKVQRRIAKNFDKDILDKRSPGFSEKMVGRTSVFASLSDALNMQQWALANHLAGYTIVVVRAKVSESLMIGEYGMGEKIVAGKSVRFLEEIEQEECF
jgi:hypothetical protein